MLVREVDRFWQIGVRAEAFVSSELFRKNQLHLSVIVDTRIKIFYIGTRPNIMQ